MVKVKICGLTNLEDARHSVAFGADLLGFNFHERSPRYVDPQVARDIVKGLADTVIKVGIFVNMESYRIDEVVEFVGLTAIQLHGDEDEVFMRELRAYNSATLIKAVRVGPDFKVSSLAGTRADGVLLDAYSKNGYGGTGESFDWTTAVAVKDRVPTLYLAGGLKPENVAHAVRLVRPYAVDVASGVESAPGIKDPRKVEAFIRNAKEA